MTVNKETPPRCWRVVYLGTSPSFSAPAPVPASAHSCADRVPTLPMEKSLFTTTDEADVWEHVPLPPPPAHVARVSNTIAMEGGTSTVVAALQLSPGEVERGIERVCVGCFMLKKRRFFFLCRVTMTEHQWMRKETSELRRKGKALRNNCARAAGVQYGFRRLVTHGDFSAPPFFWGWNSSKHSCFSCIPLGRQVMLEGYRLELRRNRVDLL